MTITRGKLLAAWAAIGLVWIVSFRAWATMAPSAPSATPGSLAAPATGVFFDSVALRSSAALIRDRNLFRLDRKPAQLRYAPWAIASAAVAPTPPGPPRPTLALVGIIGGPPWYAVIEGIPGREAGVSMGAGEDAGGIRLIRIKGDTAVLHGLDTTWVLTPKRAW